LHTTQLRLLRLTILVLNLATATNGCRHSLLHWSPFLSPSLHDSALLLSARLLLLTATERCSVGFGELVFRLLSLKLRCCFAVLRLDGLDVGGVGDEMVESSGQGPLVLGQ